MGISEERQTKKEILQSTWMYYVSAALYGFAHGDFFALGSPLVAGLFITRSQSLIFWHHYLQPYDWGAIGPILDAHIFNVTTSYQIVSYILAVLSIIALILTESLNPVLQEVGVVKF